MFWYLHPLKTCKLVPISLKDVRLGANQVPHKSPCGIRIQNVFVPWYNTNLCTSPGTFSNHRPGRKRERIYGAQAQPLGWCRPRGVCLSWQTSQQLQGRSCHPLRGRSCCAQVCAAGGKEQRDQLQGAGGGPGNGSEDGGSNGSDDGAAGRGAVDRQRTPEQVCLSWDSVCTGAPGLSPL